MARFRLTSPPTVHLVENDVEKQCRDYLQRLNYLPVRLHAGRFRTKDDRWITGAQAGMPDYVVVKNDFFLEVKRPGGQLSTVQQLKILELQRGWGIQTAVIDSLEQMVAWLAAYEARNK